MKTAKLFTNGRSQAVRLPKEYRFSGNDVYIKKIGNMVILLPKENPWESFFDSLDQFSEDYMENRSQPEQSDREPI